MGVIIDAAGDAHVISNEKLASKLLEAENKLI
jgi:hypothetical protein